MGGGSMTTYAEHIFQIECDLSRALDHVKQFKKICTPEQIKQLNNIAFTIESAGDMLIRFAEGRDMNNPNDVPYYARCRNCGERRYDLLVWDDFDLVTCETCGNIYDPEDVHFSV